jgi:hypothetical protein
MHVCVFGRRDGPAALRLSTTRHLTIAPQGCSTAGGSRAGGGAAAAPADDAGGLLGKRLLLHALNPGAPG